MKATKIYDQQYQWFVFGRDPEKKEGIIDTNQYMIKSGDRTILLDPGGIEVFASMLTAVLHYVSVDEITDLLPHTRIPILFHLLVYGKKRYPMPSSTRPGSGKVLFVILAQKILNLHPSQMKGVT